MSSVTTYGSASFLLNSSAIVVEIQNNEELTIDKDVKTLTIEKPKKEEGVSAPDRVEFVQWGHRNDRPIEILKKIYPSIPITANLKFNSDMLFGDGIMVVKKKKDDTGKVIYEEMLESEQPEIFEFLSANNYTRQEQEVDKDLTTFSHSYIEFIFNSENKIISSLHKETAFSRVSILDDGRKKWHGYAYDWRDETDIAITPMLDENTPLLDLKIRRGLHPDSGGKTEKEDKNFRYILPLSIPTLGKVYYPRPGWWSVFESGWYDISQVIPKAKKALMQNKLQVAFLVYISKGFWDRLYMNENITLPEKKAKRKKEFLENLDEFLMGSENAGKTLLSDFEYDLHKGIERKDILIEPLKKNEKVEGGDWIDDNEEATNMICYAMGVHPSLIGASPGKTKSINGTEARELFIIKQALTTSFRKLKVLPLYIIKEINGWDKDIHFVIPNIQLTTLDKNTGAVKSIGNQEI